MRTAEIVDLANERRLSASLDFVRGSAGLLVLNGGSRAEEITVVSTIRRARTTKENRSVYCVDSGTSMQLHLPVPAGYAPTDLSVSIIGGHGEMLLYEPKRPRPPGMFGVRAFATVACIAALFALGGERLNTPTVVASAEPVPALLEAPPVVPKGRLSLRVPAPLPSVLLQPTHVVVHLPVVVPRAPKLNERRVLVTAMAAVPKHVDQPDTPAPRMTDLHVPSMAKSGDFVPVRFGAVGRQVKIVASIGPTIVSKTIVAAQHGTVSIRSPKSDRDSRVMTVRAYAQDGNRSSTLQAIVVLVRP